MRVLVAGATGVVGEPVVQELHSRGHEVAGMTRSGSRRAPLEALGARSVIADALEARLVERAVREAEPEGVVSLSDLAAADGAAPPESLEPTNRLREEGTRNLVHAAVAAGGAPLPRRVDHRHLWLRPEGYARDRGRPTGPRKPSGSPAGGGGRAPNRGRHKGE